MSKARKIIYGSRQKRKAREAKLERLREQAAEKKIKTEE